MSMDIERRLHGSRKSSVINELFSNTIHFPIANIMLEMLQSGPLSYIAETDMYIILAACLIQAYVLGTWSYQGKNYRLAGNLIGPLVYTLIEVSLEGGKFLTGYNHIAYWGFSLVIGLLQQLQVFAPNIIKNALVIAENMSRTYILMLMYAIYELSEPESKPVSEFFRDESHIYIFLVTTLLGVVIGSAKVTADRYLHILRETAKTMRTFSEWFLGGDILRQALNDTQALSLKKQERCVLFVDIRGFTAWSETRSPEEVVGMLNGYFELSETCWTPDSIVKIKYTGDEIMAVSKERDVTCRDTFLLAEKLGSFLSQYGLSAGIALHTGEMVEGMIGGGSVKAYDVIGDTVNTAKRICDKSYENRIFASADFINGLSCGFEIVSRLQIDAKGKSEKISVCEIRKNIAPSS